MGNSFSDVNMCCQNNYVLQNADKDLEKYKKDITRSKNHRKDRKDIINLYEEEEDYEYNQYNPNSSKYKNNINKEIIDKHKKDSSFRNNISSFSKIDNQERISNLADILKNGNSPYLTMKVLNSSSNITKGTSIKINCQGLIDKVINDENIRKDDKDGFVYFGHFPEDYINDNYDLIDFNIPMPKPNSEKNQHTNM